MVATEAREGPSICHGVDPAADGPGVGPGVGSAAGGRGVGPSINLGGRLVVGSGGG